MALRGASGAYTTTNTGTASITYAGANAIVACDLIILDTCYRPGGFHPITDPAGFTAGASLTPALADQSFGTASHHIAVKIAVSADAGFPTYTQTASYVGSWAQQIRVYSGRVNSSVAAAFSNTAATAVGSASSTPYSYPITGVTALAGDDIVVFAGGVYSNVATAISTAISGYANGVNTNDAAAGNQTFVDGLDLVNSPAGATGTLAASITAGSAVTVTPGAFVLSLPSASSASPKPVLSGGKLLISGGHIVTGAIFMPLSWSINRRNKLAAPRRKR